MPTPLAETARVKLLDHYIGDVRAWKGDDVAETVLIAVKNPAVDVDDASLYIATKAQLLSGQLTYLGTTTFGGKSGGFQPIVFNDGLPVLLNAETPLDGQSGSFADLWAISLQRRLGAEPLASGGADTWLRGRFSAFMAALRDLAARFV